MNPDIKAIYVGGIPDQASEEEVIALFAPFGTVLMDGRDAPHFPKDESGRRKGFGFIRMATAEAVAAINGLGNAELGGAKLTINEARPKN